VPSLIKKKASKLEGPATPSVHRGGRRPRLRVLGTEITCIDQTLRRAESDLGIEIVVDKQDFLTAQRKAATQPAEFDVYDQAFHNLDIVWFWGALQPIDTRRITAWSEVSELTKFGRLRSVQLTGRGDAPVNKLFVQPAMSLGSRETGAISMLPTVYNFDSFACTGDLIEEFQGEPASWAWLLHPRVKGRVALCDDPAVGVFDAALALEALGEIEFDDIGNMSVDEIDKVMALLNSRKREGHFYRLWKTAEESAELMIRGRVAMESIWSPAVSAVKKAGCSVSEVVPKEGYRAWHGGMSLSSNLDGRLLDVAYEYLNWWLSGPAGAVMARQGYYMSVPGRVREHLSDDEWGYWYEGRPTTRDLPGPDGQITVRAGEVRPGGTHWERASRIAVWNTTMDEHNYLVRRWNSFARSD
jgi:putative spermidine/putrescine transport system substrate-binding protein